MMNALETIECIFIGVLGTNKIAGKFHNSDEMFTIQV